MAEAVQEIKSMEVRRPEIGWITFLTHLGLQIATYSIVIMVALVVLNTIFRVLPFVPSLKFVEEYTGYLLVTMACWGFAYALKTGAHVQITMVPNLMPPKARAVWEAGIAGLAILIIGIMFWHSVLFLIKSIQTWEQAQTVTLTPLWIFRMMLVPGYLLLMLEMAVHLAWKIKELRRG